MLVEECFKVTTQVLVNFQLTAAALNDLRVGKRGGKVFRNGFLFGKEFSFIFSSYKPVINLFCRATNI